MGKTDKDWDFATVDYNEEPGMARGTAREWLEASKGYVAPCFFTFEECVPEEVSYR